MDVPAQDLAWKSIYKLMTGAIVPRAIGWISTLDAKGHANLAPFSFFTVVCPNPPHVLFCPNIRSTDHGEKDTLTNIRNMGEFVVNIVTESTVEAMNRSSQELPADVDEFTVAGVTPTPSMQVKPPRVAECPVHFECVMTQIIDVSAEPGGGSVVIGQVVQVHVDESALIGGDKIDLNALQPIGRLAGASYTRVTDVFDLVRPPSVLRPEG